MRKAILALSLLVLSALNLYAQSIKEGSTSLFVSKMDAARCSGIKDFHKGEYVDSLTAYIDKIEKDETRADARFTYYNAIFGNDTVQYYRREESFVSKVNLGKGKFYNELEVESRVYPYQRFVYNIDSLDSIAEKRAYDKMRVMKTSDVLMNNEQNCVCYALQCLFDVNGIKCTPIISRNTLCTGLWQMNKFYDKFLSEKAKYPCKSKDIKNATLPDNCFLAFVNKHGMAVHAVFYSNGMFHSKNGMFSPITTNDIKVITKSYSRYDGNTHADHIL